MLLRRRSGKTAALVIALGFGGGTLLLGVGSALFAPSPSMTFLPALTGYFVATLPLFALAAIIALCKSELWFDPGARSIRLLTFRPWLFRPRVEEAPVSEYAGVRTDPAPEDDGGGILVSLVTASGESVPLRQFDAESEAKPYADKFGEAAGLWVRHASAEKKAAGDEKGEGGSAGEGGSKGGDSSAGEGGSKGGDSSGADGGSGDSSGDSGESRTGSGAAG
jgi:hypothetical protein